MCGVPLLNGRRFKMEKEIKHEWIEIQFIFDGWIECTCGFRPNSQKDMDNHDE